MGGDPIERDRGMVADQVGGGPGAQDARTRAAYPSSGRTPSNSALRT